MLVSYYKPIWSMITLMLVSRVCPDFFDCH
jgi:hypothetical protein